MNEIKIVHIGNHYQFLRIYPRGEEQHLGYSKNISSSDLIRHYLDIQDCNWFFTYPKIDDDVHNMYLNGKNIRCEKVTEFASLDDAAEYLINFKKEFEYLFKYINFRTI